MNCGGTNTDLLALTEMQSTCQVHSDAKCEFKTNAGTVAVTKAKIYDIIGWVIAVNGYNATHAKIDTKLRIYA